MTITQGLCDKQIRVLRCISFEHTSSESCWRNVKVKVQKLNQAKLDWETIPGSENPRRAGHWRRSSDTEAGRQLSQPMGSPPRAGGLWTSLVTCWTPNGFKNLQHQWCHVVMCPPVGLWQLLRMPLPQLVLLWPDKGRPQKSWIHSTVAILLQTKNENGNAECWMLNMVNQPSEWKPAVLLFRVA